MEPEAVVAITFDDGSVGRMQLFHREPQDGLERTWADDDIAAEVARSVFQRRPMTWRRCELSDFPVEHHEFRGAWTDNGKVIGVDMEKARAITRDRLRMERTPLLAAKDIESIKAIEAGDATSLEAVAAEKQRLRDITTLPAIDAAKTLDELKAISILKPAADRLAR